MREAKLFHVFLRHKTKGNILQQLRLLLLYMPSPKSFQSSPVMGFFMKQNLRFELVWADWAVYSIFFLRLTRFYNYNFFKEFGKYSHFLFDYYTTPTTTWFSAFDHVCEIVSSRLYYWERQKWCCRYLVLFHNLPIFLNCNSVPALMCKLCITLLELKVS